jgi:hypothetical protein
VKLPVGFPLEQVPRISRNVAIGLERMQVTRKEKEVAITHESID